nr:uncharacterized protein LOC109172155 [Ipomoea trifida]
MKDGFTGHTLKMHFWAVCKATTEAEFHGRMEELKSCNLKAFEWLSKRDPKHYCRAYFSTFPKSDLLLNNLCESWNSCILSFRDKPIQTMCEKIRLYLMTRMQKNRDRMSSYHSKVCPRILKLIEEDKDKCARFTAYKSVDEIYQVDENFKPFKVDLSARQLEHYLRSYGPAILPIRAKELWHKTTMPPPLPPKYKPQPGRPKKKRKIDPVVKKSYQKKATKKGEVKNCRVCGMTDSNVAANIDVQDQFQDVVVETQVPEFVLNEMESMSSQPSQPESNVIPTVSDFISSTIANDPTPSRKQFITVGGIKYTCTAMLLKKR